MERRGRHVAALEEDPLAVAARVVARLAVDRVAVARRARGARRRPRPGSSPRAFRPASVPVRTRRPRAARRARPCPRPAGACPSRRRRTRSTPAACSFGWSSMLGLMWIGGLLDVHPRMQPAAREARKRQRQRRDGAPHEAASSGLRVAHLRQVGRARLRVELGEQRVVPRIALGLRRRGSSDRAGRRTRSRSRGRPAGRPS